MYFTQTLDRHEKLNTRKEKSQLALNTVIKEISNSSIISNFPVLVFCSGSLARQEVGANSDLDLLVISESDPTIAEAHVQESFKKELVEINAKLKFPPFSNDGEYLAFHTINDLKNKTGSKKDDVENLFTVRMLFLLEGKPLHDKQRYDRFLKEIIFHYYRDKKDDEIFYPIFLLNDILRYWRTLCLNYEERRHDTSRPWRKKNVNLKFSRMLTVFSTVSCLISVPMSDPIDLFQLCSMSPLERMAYALDVIDENKFKEDWVKFLNIYEDFLSWKEDTDIERYCSTLEHKEKITKHATFFSNFIYSILSDNKISHEYKKYLIL
jgi:predicted nucleotidyltransferase